MLIVSDIQRSVRFYRDVLGATVIRQGEPSILRLCSGWLILNVGGGPTPGKPDVTMTPPTGPARPAANGSGVFGTGSPYRGGNELRDPSDSGVSGTLDI
jgi:catechol 2,3-dioxygenase-like lactoylglutathione lyase family enzyme